MKNLMVMGAAIEQVPGIKAGKEMGYNVAVIDYNPAAVGIPLADKYYNVSTIDPEGVYKAAADFHADGFLTLATDLPMRAVSYACEKLGLPGVSQHTALLATDKGEMIKALKKAGVPSPWYFILNSEEELERISSQLSYPCILKPTDNAASRGVVVINNKSELKDAFSYSREESHSGQVILEEYMNGPEVSVEVLTYEGVPHVLQITDKITTGIPHFVEVGHNQPSQLSTEIKKQIEEVACAAVKALGIEIGPAHVEIKATETGPKIIELGARLGGDCITSHLVRLSTGIDMLKETIAVLCGGKPNLEQKWDRGASIRFLTCDKLGILDHVEGEDIARKMEGVVEVSDIMKPGDTLESVRSSDDRVAYVICDGNNVPESASRAEKAKAAMKVIVK